MIIDPFNRVHDYLRISLTESCNLRCTYCMPDNDYELTPSSRLMSADEVETLARIFVESGVSKIRLTGGEPLIRRDAADIIERLSLLPVDLTLTTNGTRLQHFTSTIKNAGIRKINISLDSLTREGFAKMAGRDQFEIVWSNIRSMIDLGLDVKINVVVMRGVNDSELTDFVEWTRDTRVHVRFIEFMPFSGNNWNNDKMVPLDEMMQTISNKYDSFPLPHNKHETSKRFLVPGHKGTFAFISTMTSHFCGECNRMRLTANGRMKNCLFSKNETDLLSALRTGGDVRSLIRHSIGMKAEFLGGQFGTDVNNVVPDQIENRSMITIGG